MDLLRKPTNLCGMIGRSANGTIREKRYNREVWVSVSWKLRACVALFGAAVFAVLAGCRGTHANRPPTPTEVGYNTNNLIDLRAQADAQTAFNPSDVNELALRAKEVHRPKVLPPKRTILCLSGGGSYGAYSAGILCGWSEQGDRPNFDVVTGVSTGGLIAPFAFLGPRYDPLLRRFYTTLSDDDIYRLRPVRGVFSEALADNSPLAGEIDRTLTVQMMQDIAIEHSKGRRLYLGTTELQGRRFVAWDIGEIACRGRPQDRELIKRIMLGSSAIPGFFPPSEIPVTINGAPFVEKHVDGGVSFSVFMRPPAIPPQLAAMPEGRSLYGSEVYAIVAGKLYADPEMVKPWVLSIAAQNVSTLTYASTRADLARLWTVCTLAGMDFKMTAIPETTPAPKSSAEFNPAEMTLLFNEGVRQMRCRTAWRSTPPGTGCGEDPLVRGSTDLTQWPRSPSLPQPRR